MSRITDLDRRISENLKRLRVEAGLTQPQVASHLGITYQSYQKMEGGRHSFRASTLDRLAEIYHKRLHHIVDGSDLGIDDPTLVRASLLFHSLTDDERDEAVRHMLALKESRGT